MAMTEPELRRGLTSLAPFNHAVDLPYGLSTRGEGESTRVDSLVRHAFPALRDVYGGTLAGKRVLDVACNCGGFSIAAANAGAEHVLGFDIVERYIEQASFLRDALGLDQAEFRLLSVDEVTPETTGTFDVTLCLGILYHLEDPVGGMRQLAAVTDHAMLVDTNITGGRFTKKPLWHMNFPAPTQDKGATGDWRHETRVAQFTPTATAVEALLGFLGFTRVTRLPVKEKSLDRRYHKGGRATFLAVRD
jgi:2-polyprenyl-3-methyl-5-hydroxy-6-metoxy-1,4-benzoquinol methylase